MCESFRSSHSLAVDPDDHFLRIRNRVGHPGISLIAGCVFRTQN